MKKIGIALLAALVVISAAWGQDGERTFKIASFARSGVLWTNTQTQGRDPEEAVNLGSLDDSGNGQGRWRMEMEYDHGNNMGVKTRLQWDDWRSSTPQWIYAFVYGNFFQDQLSLSVGKLGGSPWGSGGPEMWKELEISTNGGGMRAEYKPSFVPGSLNVGVVLNYFNFANDQGWSADKPYTLLEILKESVIGASYEHPDYGLVRFAVRLDSEADRVSGSGAPVSNGEEEILYRIEEKMIEQKLPGFKVWALGYGIGLGNEDVFKLENWLFTEYAPPDLGNLTTPFTAQIRFGYDHTHKRQLVHVKPSFYWQFFDKLLSVGASFWYGQDFGMKIYEGSPYSFIEAEPKIQVKFGSNSYVAFAYVFRQEYVQEIEDGDNTVGPIKQTQKMNLRFSLQF